MYSAEQHVQKFLPNTADSSFSMFDSSRLNIRSRFATRGANRGIVLRESVSRVVAVALGAPQKSKSFRGKRGLEIEDSGG